MSKHEQRRTLMPVRRGGDASSASVGPEGLRDTLEARLSVFGRYGFWLLGAYAVIDALLVAVSGAADADFAVALKGLTIPLVFGGVWLALRLWRAPLVGLKTLDAAVTLVAAALFVWLAKASDRMASAFLPITYVTTLRAVILPSRPRTTLAITAASLLPLLVLGALPDEDWGGRKELSTAASLVLFLMRCAIVCGIATAISHVLHDLREEVRDARKIGRYRLEEKIGEGGMGQVYRASHDLLRRPTAVKILRPEKADEETLGRFEREVQLTSELTHPSTVAVYDYGRSDDGTFFYAMEYLPGLDLRELVSQHGPQPAARVIHILQQACGSLYEAHLAGMVHRDIKPPNLILCERGKVRDVVKLLDFGLAANLRDDLAKTGAVRLTKENAVLGTPRYMAPESLRPGATVGPPADLYAIGLVGYYLLTGEHAIGGDTFMEIFVSQLNQQPKRPSEIAGGPIASDLEDVLLHCMEKEPDKRPADARALARELAKCQDAGRWTEEDAERWWRDNGR